MTGEVAAILAPNNVPPDRDAAERALVELLAEGAVRRTPPRRRRPLAAGVSLRAGPG